MQAIAKNWTLIGISKLQTIQFKNRPQKEFGSQSCIDQGQNNKHKQRDKVTYSPLAKEQNPMSISELTEGDMEELPDKDFKKNIIKLLKNNKKHIKAFKNIYTGNSNVETKLS